MAGVLYIVATPIGHLEDITLRALRVLKEVDLIAAEDTRRTQKLLNHYDIRTSLTSYHEHNERSKARQLVAQLEQGENIALVCDAGTPAIADPGYRLVAAALEAGIRVTPIPGASAVAAVLSAGGLPTDRFVFEGFLPAKKAARRARLQALRAEPRTLVFFEAPHRLAESARDLYELFGDREVVVAREVSKVHEEFLRGPLSALMDKLAGAEIRGEATVLVKGAAFAPEPSEAMLIQEIANLKNTGMRVKEIAELLGARYGCAKNAIYRLALQAKSPPTL